MLAPVDIVHAPRATFATLPSFVRRATSAKQRSIRPEPPPSPFQRAQQEVFTEAAAAADADNEVDDEDATCAVCYGICCEPARASSSCDHNFCRLCVFHLKDRMSAGCPMCRAPLDPNLADAILPTDIPVVQECADAIAARHPAAYAEACDKESRTTMKMSESLIRDLPLVRHPGMSPIMDATGRPKPLRVQPRANISLYFNDMPSKLTISRAPLGQRVGILYEDVAHNARGRRVRGFVARITSVSGSVSSRGEMRVRLVWEAECETVGRLARDTDDGCIVGTVRTGKVA